MTASHIPTVSLEDLLLDTTPDGERGAHKEHLGVCQECAEQPNRLRDVERFLALMRAGKIRGAFEVETLESKR